MYTRPVLIDIRAPPRIIHPLAAYQVFANVLNIMDLYLYFLIFFFYKNRITSLSSYTLRSDQCRQSDMTRADPFNKILKLVCAYITGSTIMYSTVQNHLKSHEESRKRHEMIISSSFQIHAGVPRHLCALSSLVSE